MKIQSALFIIYYFALCCEATAAKVVCVESVRHHAVGQKCDTEKLLLNYITREDGDEYHSTIARRIINKELIGYINSKEIQAVKIYSYPEFFCMSVWEDSSRHDIYGKINDTIYIDEYVKFNIRHVPSEFSLQSVNIDDCSGAQVLWDDNK